MAGARRRRAHQRGFRGRRRIRSRNVVRLRARSGRPHVRPRHAGRERTTPLARSRHRPLQLSLSREASRSARSDAAPERVRRCSRRLRARKDQTTTPRPRRPLDGRPSRIDARTDGYACDGLLLLAYPLHPAGKPEQLRDAHLAKIKLPVFCLNGTRDALCTRDLMEHTISGLRSNWTMHWLAGADHSFHVLKSSGRSDSDVLAELGEAVSAWVLRLPDRS